MAKYVGFKIGKVHESYVISEYYCGGCGYPVTDHDSFCPECGGAFRECDASNLEAENAKLRQQLADVTESMGHVEERCAKLRDELDAAKHDLSLFSERIVELGTENAKLRELTKEMFYSLLNVAGGRRTMTAGEAQNLMSRMNDLGIEVDE